MAQAVAYRPRADATLSTVDTVLARSGSLRTALTTLPSPAVPLAVRTIRPAWSNRSTMVSMAALRLFASSPVYGWDVIITTASAGEGSPLIDTKPSDWYAPSTVRAPSTGAVPTRTAASSAAEVSTPRLWLGSAPRIPGGAASTAMSSNWSLLAGSRNLSL